MKQTRTAIWLGVMVIAMSCLVWGQQEKSKQAPLTGTWDCVAHLSGEDDIPFTMELVQKGESVTGSIATHDGELEITSGTFKANLLEIHCDTPEAKYLVTGKLEGDQFKGHWSKDTEMEGDWEGKRSTPTKSSGQDKE